MSTYNYGIYCNTPYQLFVAMCFVFNYVNKECDTVDLYVDIDNAKELNSYANKLQDVSVFNRIYKIRRLIDRDKGISKYYKKIAFYMNPRMMFEKSVIGDSIPDSDYYDITMISYLGPLPRAFIFSYPNAKIYLFEDGLGSYLSSQYYAFATKKDKFFQFITGRGEDTIHIENRFLFSPDFYTGKNRTSKLIVPLETTEERHILELLLPPDESDLYCRYQFIYLTQPIEANDLELVSKANHIENQIEEFLKQECPNDMLVRPHPRQFDKNYQPWEVDKRKLSWELSCSIKTKDDSVLIARFSTAQIVPKLLYDKEPYLMFLYKLFPENLEGTYTEIENTVSRLQRIYEHKEKILVPNSISEIESMINQVRRR